MRYIYSELFLIKPAIYVKSLFFSKSSNLKSFNRSQLEDNTSQSAQISLLEYRIGRWTKKEGMTDILGKINMAS
jgi:hypothetical protein